VLARVTLIASIFLVASAGTYLLNDAVDAPSDRLHSDKAKRPIAAGELDVRVALILGGTLLTGAVAGAGLLGGLTLALVLVTYVLVNIAYSLGLKRVSVIELACVSSGFVLRAIAGGVCVHVPISTWFIIVTSSSALLVVVGKRSAEKELLGQTGVLHRKVLANYSAAYLRTVRIIASSVAIVSFCLWAFERAGHLNGGDGDRDQIFFELAIVPFVLGILSVELAIENGEGGAPEELVLRNHLIQVLGLCCVTLIGVGIYR
jgi:decaprenyl-phosphate phosphoribosyltransferase